MKITLEEIKIEYIYVWFASLRVILFMPSRGLISGQVPPSSSLLSHSPQAHVKCY